MRQLKNFSSKNDKTPSDTQEVKQYLSQYDGLSEDQLVDRLLSAVKTAKQNGTYDDAQMSSFIAMVSPSLSEAQVSKLNNMIELIKAESN